MNHRDLAREVAKRTGLPHYRAYDAVMTMMEVITEKLIEGESVQLVGFGKFEIFTRKAREGVNPQRPSERIKMPEVKVVKFRVGHGLKNEVKNS